MTTAFVLTITASLVTTRGKEEELLQLWGGGYARHPTFIGEKEPGCGAPIFGGGRGIALTDDGGPFCIPDGGNYGRIGLTSSLRATRVTGSTMACKPSVRLLHKKDNSHYYRKRDDNGESHTVYDSDVRLASCKRR